MSKIFENIEKAELIKKIEELTNKNEFLSNLLEKKISSNSIKAYEVVTKMISNKVYGETDDSIGCNIRSALKRKIMDDVKWDLRVRRATDFTSEDIPRVEEYLSKYEIEKQYLKPVAIPVVGSISI